MGFFFPTTRVSIYRGESQDAFGDPLDDNTVSDMVDVPAFIKEQSQRTFLPEELRLTTIQRYLIRLKPGTDVREGDRVKDQYTGVWYQVQEVINLPLIAGTPSVRIAAVRIAAVGNTARTSRTGTLDFT